MNKCLFSWLCGASCARVCSVVSSGLCDPMDCTPSGSSVYGILQGRVLDSCSLLQGIFLTQGSNPCLLHCGFFTCCAAYSYYMRFNCVLSEKMQETINSVYLHVGCVSYHKSLHWSVLLTNIFATLVHKISLLTSLLGGGYFK